MKVVRVIASLLLVLGQGMIMIDSDVAAATDPSQLVVSQMYPGASGDATSEFIEIYNNSHEPTDVTNVCLFYVSASGATTSKIGCIVAPDSHTRLWLPEYARAIFVSNEFTAGRSVQSDGIFSGGISATSGHVRIVSESGDELDKLGWGSAVSPETQSSNAPANGKSLTRIDDNGILKDTNNNAQDFIQNDPIVHNSDVYEIETIPDVCPNITGVQAEVPDGYLIDSTGNCLVDSCVNMDGLQTAVPDGMTRTIDGICQWDIVPIQLTEILPNAYGSDVGNEFIEVFNPTDRMVDLSLYSIKVGVAMDKTYSFPPGSTIAPGEYRVFSDSVMKFTLPNTSSRVVLTALDGLLYGDTGAYQSPAEGESFAWFDGAWSYTNQPTPGSENMHSITQDRDDTSEFAQCAAGKYRNPLTNRCRNIVSDASVLATCDTDQYRNPETGRCKKITASTLQPCKDGQYRSEETNRCRSIATVSSLKPCNDNQYRSEETNRCRNLSSSLIPQTGYAVKGVADQPLAFAGWWAFGVVSFIALGYAGWEWRREVVAFGNRLTKKLMRK